MQPETAPDLHSAGAFSMNRLLLAALIATLPFTSSQAAEPPAAREPYGIGLEGFPYPYPVNMLPLVNDGEQLRMAYMDVPSTKPNGRTVVLLHGRNFPSSYWAPVIGTLNDAGYRVVVPDQIGFGKSSKPSGDLHFDNLARNTVALMDHLGIAKFDIVAHSLGGMLSVRIARAYPDRIDHLLLAAPIGLEDYRLYVPPTPTEKILENEDKLTAEGYRKQLEVNYSLKMQPDQVTPFIDARFNIKGSPEYPRWLRAFVSSAQLIYREPVVHEIPLIACRPCSSWAPTITTHRASRMRRKRCGRRWVRTPISPRRWRRRCRTRRPRCFRTRAISCFSMHRPNSTS
jgi:pimeloyl-ACP methyl ester carboxylesterase